MDFIVALTYLMWLVAGFFALLTLLSIFAEIWRFDELSSVKSIEVITVVNFPQPKKGGDYGELVLIKNLQTGGEEVVQNTSSILWRTKDPWQLYLSLEVGKTYTAVLRGKRRIFSDWFLWRRELEEVQEIEDFS